MLVGIYLAVVILQKGMLNRDYMSTQMLQRVAASIVLNDETQHLMDLLNENAPVAGQVVTALFIR
jgi:hypothetical protein